MKARTLCAGVSDNRQAAPLPGRSRAKLYSASFDQAIALERRAEAEVASSVPMLGLVFPALMLVNGTFFHVLPMARTRGRFSPGAATAVVLFYPLAVACYWRAARDGELDAVTLIGSLVIGAALMALPVVLLKIKDRPYFRQDR